MSTASIITREQALEETFLALELAKKEALKDLLNALDQAIDLCQDREGLVKDYDEMQCCAGTAKNCADDITALMEQYKKGEA